MSRRRIRRRASQHGEENIPGAVSASPAVGVRTGISQKLQHAVLMRSASLQAAPLQAAALQREDIEELQHKAGNQAVDGLLAGKTNGGGTAALQMAKDGRPAVARLGGTPYYGSRKVNPKLDGFEAEQNVFGPLIFRQFVRDLAVWKPLMRFVTQYWLNYGNEAGIDLEAGEEPQVWRLLNARLKPGEMRTVKNLYTDANAASKRDVLMDAFWVEFRREYEYCHRKAEEAFLSSPFLHRHEFFAAWFGLVDPPFKYRARGSN